MGHKKIVLLVMLLGFLAACSGPPEEDTLDLLDNPDAAEGAGEETWPLVDYEAVPMSDIAREQLSALRAQDLHGEYMVGINSEGEIILVELTTGQESTISSEKLVVELDSGEIRRLTETPFSENHAVLSEDRLLWTVKQACDVVEMGADGQEIIKPTGVYVLDFKTNQVEKLTSYKEPFAWLHQNTVMISEGCMAGWDVYTMRLQ